MRKSEDDIKFETLAPLFVHSHMKTYPDKPVEKGKLAW